MTVVRRVLPHEYFKYRQHLLSLDRESRYLRFGYQATDESIAAFCKAVEQNLHKHTLFCVEDANLDFIAVGHISTADSMELAFSVRKDAQGQGIGSALMRRCIQWCRANQVLKGTMVCLTKNAAIKRLCKKHGIKTTTAHGETVASIELDHAQLDTYISESTASNIDILDWAVKRIQFFFPFKQIQT